MLTDTLLTASDEVPALKMRIAELEMQLKKKSHVVMEREKTSALLVNQVEALNDSNQRLQSDDVIGSLASKLLKKHSRYFI